MVWRVCQAVLLGLTLDVGTELQGNYNGFAIPTSITSHTAHALQGGALTLKSNLVSGCGRFWGHVCMSGHLHLHITCLCCEFSLV